MSFSAESFDRKREQEKPQEKESADLSSLSQGPTESEMMGRVSATKAAVDPRVSMLRDKKKSRFLFDFGDGEDEEQTQPLSKETKNSEEGAFHRESGRKGAKKERQKGKETVWDRLAHSRGVVGSDLSRDGTKSREGTRRRDEKRTVSTATKQYRAESQREREKKASSVSAASPEREDERVLPRNSMKVSFSSPDQARVESEKQQRSSLEDIVTPRTLQSIGPLQRE